MEISSSLLTLQPGIYILRHPKGGLPPLTVSRAPGGTGKLDILSTPKTHGTVLRDGADCIVMHVIEAPVELLVTAYLAHTGAAIPALKVDQVGLDTEVNRLVPAALAKADIPIDVAGKGISIIAHIERTGDVVVSEGQCLGEPASNLRVEGFQVMWPDRPEGVDLTYSIAVEGGGTTPTVNTGKFCGTRGEARRITEVTFSLIGPQAELFQLDGSAHFSGGFQVPVSSGMSLSGPSGLEHLTSLNLRAIPNLKPKNKTINPWDESLQTKVFKAKAAVPQKATTKKAAVKLESKATKTKQF